jgi:hypothetical protein
MAMPSRPRRGSVLLEFSLTSIPLLFVLISMIWICMGMWQYHTLAEAVNFTVRYAAVHGAGCAGQSCALTVSQIESALAGRAVGVPASLINVTLTSSASTITCNPLSSCSSNASVWPSLAGNLAVTTDISVAATCQFVSPISMWVPTHGTEHFNGVTLGANATQPVVY